MVLAQQGVVAVVVVVVAVVAVAMVAVAMVAGAPPRFLRPQPPVGPRSMVQAVMGTAPRVTVMAPRVMGMGLPVTGTPAPRPQVVDLSQSPREVGTAPTAPPAVAPTLVATVPMVVGEWGVMLAAVGWGPPVGTVVLPAWAPRPTPPTEPVAVVAVVAESVAVVAVAVAVVVVDLVQAQRLQHPPLR